MTSQQKRKLVKTLAIINETNKLQLKQKSVTACIRYFFSLQQHKLVKNHFQKKKSDFSTKTKNAKNISNQSWNRWPDGIVKRFETTILSIHGHQNVHFYCQML